MTKSWLKLLFFITFLVLFLCLKSEGKTAKHKGCIGPGKYVYKKNQIQNVDKCHIKICKRKKRSFYWKLKLKKKECCNYKKMVLSNGLKKEVDGIMVACENGKIKILSSGTTWSLSDFKKNMEENCHESHSIARIGFPLLSQMKKLQDYTEEIESEKQRILKANSSWFCGLDDLHVLFKNERLTQTFPSLPWGQWVKKIFAGQTKSFGLPWQSIKRRYEDKFQKKNITIDEETRISGGDVVRPPYKYNFIAHITVSRYFWAGDHSGAGSIITHRHILTAKHVLVWDDGVEVVPSEVIVAVGVHFLSDTTNSEKAQIHSVHKIIRSPNTEMVILRLKKSMEMNNRVGIIQFYGDVQETFEGEYATVIGWGKTDSSEIKSEELREADVQILHNNHVKCKELGATSDEICAWSSPNKAPCKGDSGGPLFVSRRYINYRLIGVIEAGKGCGIGNAGIFSSVAKNIEWIEKNTATGNHIGIDEATRCQWYKPCDLGEGDCISNSECLGDLECGKYNCRKLNPAAAVYTNCCSEKSCFAPGSIITMENGSFKKIEELKIGDSVLAVNGNFKAEFSKVLGWLHKNETQPGFYLDIHTKNASITISPRHLILKKGFRGEKVFVMANHISRGDNIFVKIPTEDSFRWEPVKRILTQYKIGVYAPLTESGTIVVDNNVASCYAEVSNHNLVHSLMAPVRFIPSILKLIQTYPTNFIRMGNVLGLISYKETSDISTEQNSWMNIKMMNILNIELLVLLNYFLLKK